MEAEATSQREVTLVTPVLTHPWHFKDSELNKKIIYSKNTPLHKLAVPSQVAKLGRCMVIDLPLDGIENFVSD